MRIRNLNRVRETGGVLIVTLLICLVIGILMQSYLSLIQAQQLSVARSQSWHTAFVTAEAGVEEAMAHLNSGVTTNNLAVNNWADLGGGNYGKTSYVGTCYAVVTIKIPPAVTNTSPVVVARGFAPGPISMPKAVRTVQLNTRPKPAVGAPGGMTVLTTINMKGSGTSIDSFDSSNTNSSKNGLYNPALARDKAQVTTLSSAANAIAIDGTIKGSVRTGAGGTVDASGGKIGDSAWVAVKKNTGIQDGHFTDDANFSAGDNTLPQGKVWLSPIPGKYKINGVTYKFLLDNSASWKVGTLDGGVYVLGKDVTLYVTDDVSIGSGSQIRIANGASLNMYVGAPNANIGGNGVVNDSGLAKDFVYYGLPSNTAFAMSANAALTGQINAPNADFTLGGGGNNTYDFVGAALVKSLKMNGHFNFHYDESLVSAPASKGYVVNAWDEF